MKILLVLLLLVFFIASVYADTPTKVEFTLPGCQQPGTTEKIPRDSCSQSKMSYCEFANGQDTIHSTMEGDTNAGTYCAKGNGNCCPIGFECSPTGCVQKTSPCSNYTKKVDCQKIKSCAWVKDTDGNEICAERNSLQCSNYLTKESCQADIMNLGQTGIGTDACIIGQTAGAKRVSNCSCIWQGDDTTGQCYLKNDVLDTIYPSGQQPSGFTCLRNFTTGACQDGQQAVSWTAVITNIHPNGYSLKQPETDSCRDGSTNLICGDNIVKLPFFTWINVLAVIAALALFYLLFRKR